MHLTEKQIGVLKGIIPGAIATLLIVIVGGWSNPFSFDDTASQIERLSVAVKSALFPAAFLAISIGRLARHRFFTPEDIDGGGLSAGTAQARVLQSLLQNTLE